MVSEESIHCPRCDAGIVAGDTDGDHETQCPACGALLLVETRDEGFVLVTARSPERKPYVEPDPARGPDPLEEDHQRWRVGAFFGGIIGAAGLTIAALSAAADYGHYGRHFLSRPGAVLFLCLICSVSLIILGGSVWLFIAVGRRLARYRQWRDIRDE